MKIIRDIKQGSPEWTAMRLGVVTSSQFNRILTSKGKPSDQAEKYRNELIYEWQSGRPADLYSNRWMKRGKELEGEARAFYAMGCDEIVEEVAFIYLDNRKLVGCSPDALVGEYGGLELKDPAPATHVAYEKDPDLLLKSYRYQVQGSLWVAHRQWWDIVSYAPGAPPVIVRVERDEDYIAKLAKAVDAFVGEMLAERKELEARKEMAA